MNKIYRVNRNQNIVSVTRIGQDNKPYILNVPYVTFENKQTEVKNALIDELSVFSALAGELAVIKGMITQDLSKQSILDYIEGAEARIVGKDVVGIVNAVDVLKNCEDSLFA